MAHVQTSLGRDQYIRAVETAKDAIAAGEAIQVVLARRQSFDLPVLADGKVLDGIGLYRALRRVNPSPYLFFTRTPAFEVVGASPCGQASVAFGRHSTIAASRASAELSPAVMATIGMPKRRA